MRRPVERREVGGSWPVWHAQSELGLLFHPVTDYPARISVYLDSDRLLVTGKSRGVNCPLLPRVHTLIYIYTRARVQFSELFLPTEVFVLLASLFLKVRTYIRIRYSWNLQISVRYRSAQAFRNSFAVCIVSTVRESFARTYVYVYTCALHVTEGSSAVFFGVALRVDHRYFDSPYVRTYVRIHSRESVRFMVTRLRTRVTMCFRIVTSNTNCSF